MDIIKKITKRNLRMDSLNLLLNIMSYISENALLCILKFGGSLM